MGLAIAWELRQAGATVKVLSRSFKEAAGHAAAGMLAPQAEALPHNSPLFELCVQSRSRYPAWIKTLESFTGLTTFYWPCGIMAPVYESNLIRQNPAITCHEDPRCPAEWLTPEAAAQIQPGLGDRVVGAWWYPADAQVDNRALMHCLWMACTQSGVEILEGVTVQKIHFQGDRIDYLETSTLETSTGQQIAADHYVLATGAWLNDLLPIPVQPRKGQLVALQVPEAQLADKGLPLKTVLFAPDIYIVPRENGRIVIGATSENVGFTPRNTPAGVQAILHAALELLPSLATFPLQELWWGFRPVASDELPILGASPYENLTLATGHHRNGVLLAPITATLIKDWVLHQQSDPLLSHFQFQRFAT